MNENDQIIIGCLGKPHGVRGWMYVQSDTKPIENIFTYSNWKIKHQNQWITLDIEQYKGHASALLVKCQYIDTPEEARLYTNDEIAILKSQLPSLGEDEYYWCDLIGLQVSTPKGANLGRVASMLETGANDVLVVESEDKKQRLIPYIESVVISIDLNKKILVADWDPDF